MVLELRVGGCRVSQGGRTPSRWRPKGQLSCRGLPARFAVREETFSRETTERIRRMVHGEARPVRSISMEVFSYAS